LFSLFSHIPHLEICADQPLEGVPSRSSAKFFSKTATSDETCAFSVNLSQKDATAAEARSPPCRPQSYLSITSNQPRGSWFDISDQQRRRFRGAIQILPERITARKKHRRGFRRRCTREAPDNLASTANPMIRPTEADPRELKLGQERRYLQSRSTTIWDLTYPIGYVKLGVLYLYFLIYF
jgi:hypothetical protein